MNELNPSFGAICFAAIGSVALFKCLDERKLAADQIYLIALLGVSSPSFALHFFGDFQALRSHGVSDFFLWQSAVPVFWCVLCTCFVIFGIDTKNIDKVGQTAKPPKFKLFRFVVVGSAITIITLVIFMFGTEIMFGSICSSVKCRSGEFLFGNRQTIHGPLLISSIFNNLFFCGLTIKFFSWLNSNRDREDASL